MAGGSGTRLWPLSRTTMPKQALAMAGERTMYQTTVDRLGPIISPERIHVVTSSAMAKLFQEQTPEVPAANFIIEPFAKDSGPAAALGLAHVHRIDPAAIVAILAADHFIGNTNEFVRVLEAAQQPAVAGFITTLGIKPDSASTGFGYVERGEVLAGLGTAGHPVFRVVAFREKPTMDVATSYFEGGLHSWNSGMFIMSAAVGLAEFGRQQPEFAAAITQVEMAVGTVDYPKLLANAWDLAPKKSIDFAIMEGAENIAVIPMEVGWSDIGSWASLLEVLEADAHGNVILGDHITIDTTGTLIRGGKRVIATIGLRDLIVIDTPDALLICARDSAQDVRQVVEQLKASNRGHLV